jgi:hypothetical protein
MTMTGSCLCRGVCFDRSGPLRDVVVCHCKMCRRTDGHVGAYTAARKDVVTFMEARTLRWYPSSADGRRGFCNEGRSTLFRDADRRETISIAAGTLDAPTSIRTTLQIHVASAGDHYDVDASVPTRPG